jgi:hypothetical protein
MAFQTVVPIPETLLEPGERALHTHKPSGHTSDKRNPKQVCDVHQQVLRDELECGLIRILLTHPRDATEPDRQTHEPRSCCRSIASSAYMQKFRVGVVHGDEQSMIRVSATIDSVGRQRRKGQAQQGISVF